MRRALALALLTALAAAPSAPADAQSTTPIRSPVWLLPGDSVRVWGRGGHPLRGMRAQVAWQRADSLALTTSHVFAPGDLSRLRVRRTVMARSPLGAVGGAVLGLTVGAVVGGVIGYGTSGGFDGTDEGYGDGMGVLLGVPAGAVAGMVIGGVWAGHKRPRTRWVNVPLP